MPGPRRDKAIAWEALEKFLREEGLFRKCKVCPELLLTPDDMKGAIGWSVEQLRASGRMDARQVKAVKVLLSTVIRVLSLQHLDRCAAVKKTGSDGSSCPSPPAPPPPPTPSTPDDA